jgi:hypothetical protein
MARAISAFAWTNPGTEQIERYESKIERRLRKQLKELEARQAARRAKARTRRGAILP